MARSYTHKMPLLRGSIRQQRDALAGACREVEQTLKRCIQDDGSWTDCPAAYKRSMLTAVCTALAVLD